MRGFIPGLLALGIRPLPSGAMNETEVGQLFALVDPSELEVIGNKCEHADLLLP